LEDDIDKFNREEVVKRRIPERIFDSNLRFNIYIRKGES